MTEQTSHCAVDRADSPGSVDKHDHPMHGCHHCSQQLCVTFVEVETVPIGYVAGDDQDQLVGVARTRLRIDSLAVSAPEFEVSPRAVTRSDPQRYELSEPFRDDCFHRRCGEVQIIRVDQIEYKGVEQVSAIPAEHLGGGVIGVSKNARAVDRQNWIGEPVI